METRKERFKNKLPIQSFIKSVDSFVQESTHSINSFVKEDWFRIDLEESEHIYLVQAELPGFQTDEIQVYAIGNELHIQGKHNTNEETENGKNKRKAKRVVSLPFSMYPKDIAASYQNGILTIIVQKNKLDTFQIPIH